ncbi:hypothetical protein, partial [Allosphingosinicella sp.]|uniref:hypothetical protein n=1 Tax=Allosphingosinicella sp. TaxID=2823234 RepID=UPI002F114636
CSFIAAFIAWAWLDGAGYRLLGRDAASGLGSMLVTSAIGWGVVDAAIRRGFGGFAARARAAAGAAVFVAFFCKMGLDPFVGHRQTREVISQGFVVPAAFLLIAAAAKSPIPRPFRAIREHWRQEKARAFGPGPLPSAISIDGSRGLPPGPPRQASPALPTAAALRHTS